MIVKLLTEHHLEFLSFKGGCTGSSESTLVKMPRCWKSQSCRGSYGLFHGSEHNTNLTVILCYYADVSIKLMSEHFDCVFR